MASSTKTTKEQFGCSCDTCRGCGKAIKEFIKVWSKRSKYHFGDRILVAAIRELRQTIKGE